MNQSSRGPSTARSVTTPDSGTLDSTRSRHLSSTRTLSPPQEIPTLHRLRAKTGQRVGTGRVQHAEHIESSAHREIGAQTSFRRPELDHLTGGEVDRRSERSRFTVDGERHRRTGHRNPHVNDRAQGQSAEHTFDGGRVVVIAEHSVRGQVGRSVRRPGTPDAHARETTATQILEQAQRPGSQDLERSVASACTPDVSVGISSPRPLPAESATEPPSTNRTHRPGPISAGGSRSTSHSATSVLPISCQPPGDALGYTALNPPASATDPAGTRSAIRPGGARPTRAHPRSNRRTRARSR